MFFKKKSFGSTYDFIIVGLGNPESKYENTRHNAGFRAIDAICKKCDASLNRQKFKSMIGECTFGDSRCLLMKPLTYMNNSGEAVVEAMRFYKLQPENVIVIFDDATLDVGKLRLRRKGSHGGHNGIKSIIQLSGSEDFPRIKIGVGQKPHPDYDIADWVLGKFKPEDSETLEKSFQNAARAAECIVTSDMDKAMNRYSR